MSENRETNRPTTRMLDRLVIHMNHCQQCRTCFQTKGTVKPCETGYGISMDWLEHQAKNDDKTAQMYLKGIQNAAGMGD